MNCRHLKSFVAADAHILGDNEVEEPEGETRCTGIYYFN